MTDYRMIVKALRSQAAKLTMAADCLTGDTASPVHRKKRRMSAEGRRRISEAMKRRWAVKKRRGNVVRMKARA